MAKVTLAEHSSQEGTVPQHRQGMARNGMVSTAMWHAVLCWYAGVPSDCVSARCNPFQVGTLGDQSDPQLPARARSHNKALATVEQANRHGTLGVCKSLRRLPLSYGQTTWPCTCTKNTTLFVQETLCVWRSVGCPYLELNVSCLLNELLYEQCVITKCGHRLSLCQGNLLEQLRLQQVQQTAFLLLLFWHNGQPVLFLRPQAGGMLAGKSRHANIQVLSIYTITLNPPRLELQHSSLCNDYSALTLFHAMRMPLPPPPADALIMTG